MFFVYPKCSFPRHNAWRACFSTLSWRKKSTAKKSTRTTGNTQRWPTPVAAEWVLSEPAVRLLSKTGPQLMSGGLWFSLLSRACCPVDSYTIVTIRRHERCRMCGGAKAAPHWIRKVHLLQVFWDAEASGAFSNSCVGCRVFFDTAVEVPILLSFTKQTPQEWLVSYWDF